MAALLRVTCPSCCSAGAFLLLQILVRRPYHRLVSPVSRWVSRSIAGCSVDGSARRRRPSTHSSATVKVYLSVQILSVPRIQGRIRCLPSSGVQIPVAGHLLQALDLSSPSRTGAYTRHSTARCDRSPARVRHLGLDRLDMPPRQRIRDGAAASAAAPPALGILDLPNDLLARCLAPLKQQER